jgi:hypothetical protein
MRTTLTIDDQLAEVLKETAYRSGKSFKQVVNDTLRAGLDKQGNPPPKVKPYRVKVVSLGGVKPGIDLDKALQLADGLEEAEILRKLRLRK